MRYAAGSFRAGMLAAPTRSVAILVVGMSTTLAGAGTAGASPFITPHGAGGLRLGATVKTLHRKGLIGGLRKGCELDPGQRIAPLRSPLQGWAVFESGHKTLSSLTVEGGAETASHIGIGSTATEARKAYPTAHYQAPGTAGPFAEGFLWVPNISKPKMTLIIEPNSRQVEAISVPSPSFCE
jgi:hypothetical protein